MKAKKTIVIKVLLALMVLVFCVCAYKAASIMMRQQKEQSSFDRLALQAAEKRGQRQEDASGPLPEYVELKQANPHLFGWIRIEGTPVDYPVMHTPEDPEYYLHRAFDGSYALSGSLFLDGACREEASFYLVYGHHMKNGAMFGTLPEYADPAWWQSHPLILFDTLYERREYQVLASFYSDVSQGSASFPYYEYTDLSDPSVFEEYVEAVRACAIYDTGLSAQYGDQLIALSTCSYHTDNGRFVVVAKRTDTAGS